MRQQKPSAMKHPEAFLKSIFENFLNSCKVSQKLPQLPISSSGNTLILAIGKAAVQLAEACEEQLLTRFHGHFPAQGIMLCRHQDRSNSRHFEIYHGAHPIPDQSSVEATTIIEQATQQLKEGDHLICLLSGGGSALLCHPCDAINLSEKQKLCEALLLSGASIEEINCVRKHLSQVKGGRLAKLAHPARTFCFAISDVVDDKAEVIASGPTVGDPNSLGQALAIIKQYDIDVEPRILQALDDPSNESPYPDDLCFAHNQFDIILSAKQAFDELISYLEQHHKELDIHFLGHDLTGEAQDIASKHAKLALALANKRLGRAQLILSGGELTVTVGGCGTGGPNTEYALALALALDAQDNIFALAADSDGYDGNGGNAGAIVTPASLDRLNGLAQQYLSNNDSYNAFKISAGLLTTGPTYTNVNDLRAILVLPSAH